MFTATQTSIVRFQANCVIIETKVELLVLWNHLILQLLDNPAVGSHYIASRMKLGEKNSFGKEILQEEEIERRKILWPYQQHQVLPKMGRIVLCNVQLCYLPWVFHTQMKWPVAAPQLLEDCLSLELTPLPICIFPHSNLSSWEVLDPILPVTF